MNDLLAYPDLVTRLPNTSGQCGATVRPYRGGAWRCTRRATWLVQGQVPECGQRLCGQHAAVSLRRELQDRTDSAAGS